MTNFRLLHDVERGRIGVFSFPELDNYLLQTPVLFPVAQLITGTTARGGATWKYVLQADRQHGLLRRRVPVLSQVLHFLDYRISPNGLRTWREHSIRGLYNTQVEDLNYQGPIFLDSGGFQLMWRQGLDLSRYDISLQIDEEARSILQLQRDLGGNIVASLDYPLPPRLDPDEADQRMARSRQNAIRSAQLLRDDPEFADYNPFLYMAVHGLSPEEILNYVTQLFADIENLELGSLDFGLAIGSLVPLRSSHNSATILRLVRAAVSAIPENYRNRVPIHVFGVTGLLIPFLAYCGVDTFDSSTFAQDARALKYLVPGSYKRLPVLRMSSADLTCDCRICRELDLREVQESLVSETTRRPLPSGHYKSKYYADIALHNLELEFAIVERTKQGIEAGALDEYLIELARDIPRMQEVLASLIEDDSEIRRQATRTVAATPDVAVLPETTNYVTLTHQPSDFNINRNGYVPQGTRPILLIIPCSSEKPYSVSRSHTFLAQRLEREVPRWRQHIDKVTLSGLFGPVPSTYEDHSVILHYEFRLTIHNNAQIQCCTDRLVEFLERHGEHYKHCVAYGTSSAYRKVFELAAQRYERLVVLPETLRARKLTEFFRSENVLQLTDYLSHAISDTE